MVHLHRIGRTVRLLVGLASAPSISGPYTRLPNGSAVRLINGSGTAKPYSYNVSAAPFASSSASQKLLPP